MLYSSFSLQHSCRELQAPEEDIIASKIFVGNLSYETSQAELEALFAQVGEVTEVFMPVDRATGRPRGFAFVEFSDHASISEAVTKFDGTELQGRPLKVNEARERAARPPGGGGFGFNPEMGADAPPKSSRPKGSRRGIRGKKRGFS